jgi:hypothetical protein
MDGASRLFCGSKVGKAQHSHQNGSTKTRFKERWAQRKSSSATLREIAYCPGVHGW